VGPKKVVLVCLIARCIVLGPAPSLTAGVIMAPRRPSTTKSKKSMSRKGGKSGTVGPPSTALAYTGPVAFPRSEQLAVRGFNIITQVASNGGGAIQIAVLNNPNASADWAAAASLYTEFRCLAFSTTYVPQFTTYSTSLTPTQSNVMVLALSRDAGASVPLNASAALQVQPNTFGPMMRQLSLEWKMSGPTEALWLNTRTVSATAQIFLVATALTPSATYGQLVTQYAVQFRNPS
jgi:hypothetical protein